MRGKDIILFACKSTLRGLRSKLISITAVAIGIAAVTMLSVLSAAAGSYIKDRLKSVGISGLAIVSKSRGFELLESRFDEISCVMPLTVEFASLSTNGITKNTLLWGIGTGAENLISAELICGRYPTKEEIENGAEVVVIESSFALESYRRVDITGKDVTVTLNGVRVHMKVIGVAQQQSEGLLQMISSEVPGFTYLPYTTLAYLGGRKDIGQLAVEYDSGADKELLTNKIAELLSRSTGKPKSDYEIEDIGGYKDKAEGALGTVSLLITAVAAVSLVVAGLCIMSTMLSAGREKKKEIGTMMAIGAGRRDIILSFLAESAIITLAGGIAGILFGLGSACVVINVLGLKFYINTALIFFTVLTCVASGLLFGILPAISASRMDPVRALRED